MMLSLGLTNRLAGVTFTTLENSFTYFNISPFSLDFDRKGSPPQPEPDVKIPRLDLKATPGRQISA